MIYRELGKTGKKISLLSFGGMRIPRVSVSAAVKVIHRACELGVNTFETAPGYGNSEHKIGVALRELDRSKIFLSTKSHPGTDKTPKELRERLEESLKRLETNYIDFYQIWGINNEEHFDLVFKKDGLLTAVRQAQKENLIHHIGFTTHAHPNLIMKIMSTKEFESLTMIYHLFKHQNKKILDYAEKLKMGVIAIAPLCNGFLAHPAKEMKTDFHPYDVRDYSLKWLANDPRVTTISSGMKTLKELEENYKALKSFSPFTTEEKSIEGKIWLRLKNRLGKDFCTECEDCLPCHKNINIPELMRVNNLWKGYNAEYYCKDRYKFTGNGSSWYPGVKAIHCDNCGDCEPRCPEHLPITSLLKQLHTDLYAGERIALSNL